MFYHSIWHTKEEFSGLKMGPIPVACQTKSLKWGGFSDETVKNRDPILHVWHDKELAQTKTLTVQKLKHRVKVGTLKTPAGNK